MRIATWNVNSVGARLPRLNEWLEIAAPDVLCLQEIKCATEQFPGERAEELGYEIAAHGDLPNVEQAEDYYRQALALAAELGMRPLVAHCHLGLGTLYRRTGDSARAQEHLTAATTMYREMGMTFWLEKAEAVLGPLHS